MATAAATVTTRRSRKRRGNPLAGFDATIDEKTANAALEFADTQVFGPERDAFDWIINRRIMIPAGFSLVRFKGDARKAKAVYEGVQSITPEDVAETIHFVATLPPHVNVNSIELMATMQSFSSFAIHRT